ncbi:hypothetical protein ACTQ6A_14185 [Lachnospiraceae bacterium LCP25S3_G4]
MRRIPKKEIHKRGCEYCTESIGIGKTGEHFTELKEQKAKNLEMIEKGYEVDRLSHGWCCKHDRCPYTELDNFSSYEEYLKSSGGNIREVIKRLRGDIK